MRKDCSQNKKIQVPIVKLEFGFFFIRISIIGMTE